MTISPDLTYAILALDSYNRGYNEGVPGLGGLGTNVASYTIIEQPDLREGSIAVSAGFYAAAYRDLSGNIVISYRGTDGIAAGDYAAWGGGLGFQTLQAELAAQFYYQVKQTNPDATITLTGHSLGGGLAGLVAARANHRAAEDKPLSRAA